MFEVMPDRTVTAASRSSDKGPDVARRIRGMNIGGDEPNSKCKWGEISRSHRNTPAMAKKTMSPFDRFQTETATAKRAAT
jgi:hypothetical protein